MINSAGARCDESQAVNHGNMVPSVEAVVTDGDMAFPKVLCEMRRRWAPSYADQSRCHSVSRVSAAETSRVLTGTPALFFFLFASVAFGQNPPILTWKDTINPPSTTYTVYRAAAPCSPIPAFAPVGAGITSKSFTDNSPLTPGIYAYAVSATVGKRESAKGGCVEVNIPAPPTELLIALKKTGPVIVEASMLMPNGTCVQGYTPPFRPTGTTMLLPTFNGATFDGEVRATVFAQKLREC